MKRINTHNYEAWLLDYIEGSLSTDEIDTLRQFLEKHPQIKTELDDFEQLCLQKPAVPKIDWSSLRQPDTESLKLDAQKRASLFFKILEEDATPEEHIIFDALMAQGDYQKEYALWEKSVLQPTATSLSASDKDRMYRFGLDQPVNKFNFDYHLIAFTEGLLDNEQVASLKCFSEKQKGGKEAFERAAKMRLAPPQGIFYPDKTSLYQKENKRAAYVWFYRAAAVVLLIGLGLSILINDWGGRQKAIVPLAEQQKPDTQRANTTDSNITPIQDTTAIRNNSAITKLVGEVPANNARSNEDPKQRSIVASPSPQAPFRENNMAHQAPPEHDRLFLQPLNVLPAQEAILVENGGAELMAYSNPTVKKDFNKPEVLAPTIPNAANVPKVVSKSSPYYTIPELIASSLAKELDAEEADVDQLALALARKVGKKASEVFDAEISKSSDLSTQYEVYTFRLGSFKVEHTRKK